MSKRFKAIIKECRALLIKDVAKQLAQEGSPETTRLQDAALALLLEFAVLRCLEGQRGQMPQQAAFAADAQDLRTKLTITRQILQSEIGVVLNSGAHFTLTLSEGTLQTLRHHLVESIAPDEWRTAHILGWLYQYFCADTPEQKAQGKFYTPEPIAEYIVAQVFDALGDGQADIRDCTLLDLGCGSGVFALRAFERLHHLYKNAPCPSESVGHAAIPQQILESHLFLVDNDPWACQIAAINLYLQAKRVEPTCQPKRLNIVCADALRQWEQEADSPYQAFFARKYDLLVGNPPYLVVNQLRTPKDVMRRYKSYQSAAFKLNTFALFIERGLNLLKPNGILGMIVPNTLLTQVYFEPLRKYLLKTGKILRIIDTKRMFDNAFVENCILLVQREAEGVARSRNRVECVTKISSRSGTSNAPVIASAAKHPSLTPAPGRGGMGRGGDCFAVLAMTAPFPDAQMITHIPQHRFEHAPFNMFNIHLDDRTLALMEKIARGNPKLGEICESHDGVNPGNAKSKLIISEKLDETCQKVLNGKNIGRYWLKWDGLYVRYNRNILTNGDNVRWGHQAALDSAKILTRQTADRIIGTFANGEYYVTNSIHTTVLQNGVRGFQLKYLLGLLNSKLLSFYYRKLFPEDGQLFSQVKLINLRQLPLKPGSASEQQLVIAGVETLLQAHQMALTPSEKRRRVLQELDDTLDQAVYRLYQLTAAEIQLVTQAMENRKV